MNLLERLLANRDERVAARDAILAAVELRGAETPAAVTTLTVEEETEFRRLCGELSEIDVQVPILRDQALADAQADVARRALGVAQFNGPVRIINEPLTYRREGEFSWFRDRARAADPGTRDEVSLGRLNRYREELAVLAKQGGMEQRVNPNTLDGQGGDFVPPLWLMDWYVPIARAGRVTAELCQSFPLPMGTDSVNIPKLNSGTSVAPQTEGTAPQNTDLTTTAVSGHVETFSGQQIITMQLLEQSPAAIDQILFQDLIADYNVQLDKGVVFGTGASPQLRGITQVAGINATTFTSASPTLPLLYPKLIKAMQDINTGRFLPAQAFVMHPRRWGWALAQLDANNRPLIVPNQQGPQNAFAGMTDVRAQGAVGGIAGIPVYLDPNIPTNLGAGTNEDIIICARFDDLFLFEGTMKTRVLFETDAATLKVRYQIWAYATFIGGRLPASISTVGGTGLNVVLT